MPIFVTVDPARDTPAAMRKYLRDFHPSMIGLRGDYEATKRMCKTFRVYFSTPPNKKPTDDYLVDHSILCVSSVEYACGSPALRSARCDASRYLCLLTPPASTS